MHAKLTPRRPALNPLSRQSATTADSSRRSPARQDEDGSSDHFDEIRQFLAGVEIYPFAGRVQIGQATVVFALDPYQIRVIWKLPAGLDILKMKLDSVSHWNGGTLACPLRPCQ